MIDYQELMYRVDGNKDLLNQIIKLFLKTSPVLLMRIEDGIKRSDSRQVQHAAHLLKGMIGNFAAHSVMEKAKAVEDKAKTDDFCETDILFQTLKRELAVLEKALSDLGNEQNQTVLL
jgi:two-component system, sensor histidine kinase and response regulator